MKTLPNTRVRPHLLPLLFALPLTVLASATGCALAQPAVAPGTASVPRWTQMPLLSPEQKKAGIFPGGEGCQWPRDLQISESDPNFLILGIDVGGLYRTLDGGKHWEQASVGWNARGCNGVAIDPRNPDHVIGLGGNGNDWNATWGASPHGIYVSTNRAASWKPVLSLLEGYGNSVAIDPGSFDTAKGICTVAYVASVQAGLLKTSDGGATWGRVSDLPVTVEQPDAGTPIRVKVSPTGGRVYLGGKNGLYVSADGGKSFVKTRDGGIFGLSTVPSLPETLWASGSEGLLISRDQGKTFTVLPEQGVDREADNKPVRSVTVSPADPKRMTIWVQGDNWKWVRYVSEDGGAAFTPIKIVTKNDPMPSNVRNGYNAWHPRDPNILYGIGGDIVTRSTDGGKTLSWYNNGYNGVMLGGMMNFSAHDRDTVFLAFQDYNGAFTRDGGATWNYRDVSGKGWGGFCYGGHSVDRATMFCGDAEGWGGTRRLRLTRDGGKTWSFARSADGKDIALGGANVSLSDPVDADILFCYDHRSTDRGKTWEKMNGCDGVFTFSPASKVLFGRNNNRVVRSRDHGATWENVADTTGSVDDIAVDHATGRIYIASEEQLKVWSDHAWHTIPLPADQFGKPLRCRTVATDPRAPAVVYAGGSRDIYATQTTIVRTTDSGKTWRNLTVTTALKPGLNNGPHEVSCIRVHPVTRQAWVAGQCYGMWRIDAPAPGEKGLPPALASAPLTAQPPLATKPVVAHAGEAAAGARARITITNGDMEVGSMVPDGWSDKWEGRGKITLTRDTMIHAEGNASLKIETTGDTQGQGAQMIADAPAGATFTISGAIRSKGNIKANFALQPRDASWAPVGFVPVGYVQNDSEWQSFTKTITLPSGSVHAAVVLYVEGEGAAWLDNVKIGAVDTSHAKLSEEFAPPPTKQDPILPFKGYWADYPTAWLDYARALKQSAHEAKPEVIFLGDSITQGWKDKGITEWNKRFAPLHAFNAGIGGDKTNQILWRIQDGLLDGLAPKLIVLAIGVNNLWNNEFGNARVAEGIAACVKAAKAKCPSAKVVVVGIFPTQQEATNGMRETVKAVNAITRKMCDSAEVRFVDFGDKFLQADGSISSAIMPDFLHPNADGYMIYGTALEPIVKEMAR